MPSVCQQRRLNRDEENHIQWGLCTLSFPGPRTQPESHGSLLWASQGINPPSLESGCFSHVWEHETDSHFQYWITWVMEIYVVHLGTTLGWRNPGARMSLCSSINSWGPLYCSQPPGRHLPLSLQGGGMRKEFFRRRRNRPVVCTRTANSNLGSRCSVSFSFLSKLFVVLSCNYW